MLLCHYEIVSTCFLPCSAALILFRFFFIYDNNVGFFNTAHEAGGELQDAESYYRAIKDTVERVNTIGLGTDDPPVMRACRKKVILLFVYMFFLQLCL